MKFHFLSQFKMALLYTYIYICVCVCVRACVRVCVHVYIINIDIFNLQKKSIKM